MDDEPTDLFDAVCRLDDLADWLDADYPAEVHLLREASLMLKGHILIVKREPPRELRCPDCGQPIDLMVAETKPVTDPRTGHTELVRLPIRYCPSAFHFDPQRLSQMDYGS